MFRALCPFDIKLHTGAPIESVKALYLNMIPAVTGMVWAVLICRAAPVKNCSLQIFAERAKTRVKGEKWG